MDYAPPFYMLAKFGREQHVRAFRERGQLYMNSLAYFWNLEKDAARQDWMEGADNLIHPDEFADNFSFTVGGQTYGINRDAIAGPIKVSWGMTAATNIFCMYAFRAPAPEPLVDPRNFEFGDSAVLVLKVTEFIDRVERFLTGQALKYKIALVEYGEPQLGEARPLNVYKKTRRFEYQSEFRIAAFQAPRGVDMIDKPLNLELGSLEDITSDLLPLKEINNLVSVGAPRRKAAPPHRTPGKRKA